MRKKILYGIVFAAGAGLVFPLPGTARFISAFILAYYLPGLVFLRFTEDSRNEGTTFTVLPFLFSPVILTLMVLAVHPLVRSLSAALNITYVLLYALLAIDLVRRRGSSVNGWNPPLSSLLISILFAGIVLTAYMLNGFLLIRSDSWAHACYVNEIIDRGIPPYEARFPDIRLRYMWIYHLFQACFIRLSGTGVFTAMGVFNIVNALAFPWLIAKMVSFISTRREHLVYIPLLSIAGFAAATWILWPFNIARALSGDVKGMEEIRRVFERIDLDGTTVLHFLKSHWTWMVSIIDKYMTVTAFGYTLNLFVCLVILALDRAAFNSSRFKTSLRLLFILVGMILFHLITGMTSVLMLVGALPVFLILSRLSGTGKAAIKDVLTLSITAILAAGLTVPYIFSILGGAKGSTGTENMIHIGIKSLLTIAAPLAILFFPVRRAVRKYLAGPDESILLLFSWIITLFGVNLLINLPGVNESKFIFPLFIILLPLIGIEIIDKIRDSSGIKRGLALAWIIILFGIPSILTIRGFIIENPAMGSEHKRWNTDESDREVFNWIENNTDVSAVVIERNAYGFMPIFAHRRNFFPSIVAIVTLGYSGEKVKRYGRIKDNFFSEHPFDPSDIDYLNSTGIDFIVVLWREDEESVPGLTEKFLSSPEYFREEFRNGKAWIFTLVKGNGE